MHSGLNKAMEMEILELGPRVILFVNHMCGQIHLLTTFIVPAVGYCILPRSIVLPPSTVRLVWRSLDFHHISTVLSFLPSPTEQMGFFMGFTEEFLSGCWMLEVDFRVLDLNCVLPA
jgi:hypothetical protein